MFHLLVAHYNVNKTFDADENRPKLKFLNYTQPPRRFKNVTTNPIKRIKYFPNFEQIQLFTSHWTNLQVRSHCPARSVTCMRVGYCDSCTVHGHIYGPLPLHCGPRAEVTTMLHDSAAKLAIIWPHLATTASRYQNPDCRRRFCRPLRVIEVSKSVHR